MRGPEFSGAPRKIPAPHLPGPRFSVGTANSGGASRVVPRPRVRCGAGREIFAPPRPEANTTPAKVRQNPETEIEGYNSSVKVLVGVEPEVRGVMQ